MSYEMAPIADLAALLAHMQPSLRPGTFVFASLDGDVLPPGLTPLATFQESEGLSVIVEEAKAVHAGLTPLYRAAWITLNVNSDLHAVGLTAAVARALTDAGISCNVVAAARHDHLFVPLDRAEHAMDALRQLCTSTQGPSRA